MTNGTVNSVTYTDPTHITLNLSTVGAAAGLQNITITNIYTANAAVNGSLVEVIKFIATATTSAGFIRLYRSAGGGASWKLIGQVAVAAFTPSATVQTAEAFYTGIDMPLRLNAGDTLGAAPTQANAFSCFVQGGPLVNSDS